MRRGWKDRPRRGLRRLAAIGLVLALLTPSRAIAVTGWTGPEVIVPGYVTMQTVGDAQGKLHMVIHPANPDDPNYSRSFYATNKSGAWVISKILAPTTDVSYDVREIAVNDAGRVFILYTRVTQAAIDMRVLTNRTGAWTSVKVLGFTTSIGIDLAAGNDGRIHLAWWCDGPSGEPATSFDDQAVCVKSESSFGTFGSIFATSEFGIEVWPQLEVDSAGHDHLLYDFAVAYEGHDLRYATNASGTWKSGIIAWDHNRWRTNGRDDDGGTTGRCVADIPNRFHLAIGPNDVPQFAASVLNDHYPHWVDGGCGGEKGLYNGRWTGSAWSVAKVRTEGEVIDLEVDGVNRAHMLTRMCSPVCPYAEPTDRHDVFHAVKTSTGWAWTRLTAGWKNDRDIWDSVAPAGEGEPDLKALVVMPWNKPCMILPGGFTSDPYWTSGALWRMYRMCQT